MTLKNQKQQWILRNVFLAITFIIVYLVQRNGYSKLLDQKINLYLSGYNYGFLNWSMTVITHTFGPLIITVLSIIIFTIMIKKHRYLLSKVFAAHITCSLISFTLIKLAVQRIRPSYKTMYLIDEFSFPSGHATMSIAFYGFLLWVLHHKVHTRSVLVVTDLLFVSIVILVGISRIILDYHWFTDVLGGYVLGLFWLSLFSYACQDCF